MILGTLITGSAVGLFALRGRLERLSLGFRKPLDVALDVDNYLREHPRNANPTARIFARFVSLLRHLAAWRAPDGGGYDAVVIIAHSQGTVITADLLRLLCREREADSRLARFGPDLPVYLFTMGCPLRQLYGARFPHLYGWARHDNGGPLAWAEGDIPKNQEPDPTRLLGVRLWVNAYGSGDYIGRHLWRRDDSDYVHDAIPDGTAASAATPVGRVSEDQAGRRREMCVGAGGHVHYWDPRARSIAEELDRLIVGD